MIPLERLKRRVVSRLTDEPDVIRLKDQIDGKVAILRYKNKEIILERINKEIYFYMKSRGDYNWNSTMIGYTDVDGAIEEAKRMIKEEG